jgi:hypothetical protein
VGTRGGKKKDKFYSLELVYFETGIPELYFVELQQYMVD